MDHDFVFSTDWHLKERIWSNRPELVGDTEVASDQVVRRCLDLKLPLVLGGDNFDDPFPTSNMVDHLAACVRSMRDAGLAVYGIDGNHDMSSPSWLTTVGAMPINHEPCLIGRMNIYGFGYHYRDQVGAGIAELASRGVKYDAVIAHQLLDLTCRRVGIWNMEAASVPRTLTDLVLMGDYHAPTSVCNDAGVTFVYGGSPCAMDIGEIDGNPDRRCVLVGAGSKLTYVPLRTRQFITVYVDSAKQLARAFEGEIGEMIDRSGFTYTTLRGREYAVQPVVVLVTPADLQRVRQDATRILGSRAYVWHRVQRGEVAASTQGGDVANGETDRQALLGTIIDGLVDPGKCRVANELARRIALGGEDATRVATEYCTRELELAKLAVKEGVACSS